ncbi:MAG: Retron-type reverse transcriptase [Candidatus Magnetoglobus multicellularis str. Araruama]|uniref:Retron-type reverse transcriptase n=1 Tax=Candidatus Magnetoglobus multicellularis str. Araruama TaxID=890399 RepID=A0A1V1NY39_9BACT|nr:MAG: Retron-type reverse transcriptase [Candidatus Magnetoglobus multicellularis str. Araruama]
MKNLFSLKNLYSAYYDCRKNKRNTHCALQFELQSEDKLIQLAHELQSHNYRPLPSTCFVTASPKQREVFAANFKDRVVHHLLVKYLEPKWERKFIYDSYACRKNKGTHAAVKRLQQFMRKASNNGSKPAYYLHLDIRSFFVSIHKQILYDLITHKENHPDIKWLLKIIIFNDPTKKAIKLKQLSLFDNIPKQKSLFGRNNQTGLPIGNYTSQFFANVYLNPLDQFVKHHLKCKYYIRYVDDMVLLGPDHYTLEQWEKQIIRFLKNQLSLSLNPKQRRLAPVKNGCNFLGYIIKPSHLLVRKRTVNKCKNLLNRYEKKLITNNEQYTIQKFDLEILSKLQATLSSYLGQFLHAACRNLIKKIITRFSFLNDYFIFQDNYKAKLKCSLSKSRTLKMQYQLIFKHYPKHIIFFRWGVFMSFMVNREK